MRKIYTYLYSLLCISLLLGGCTSDPCSFNIDKHEILTGIDIPKVRNSACIPQDELGFKLSIWELDTLALIDKGDYSGLRDYMDHFSFEKLTGEINKDKISLIPDAYQQSLLGKELYYKDGERNGKKWIMILNAESGILYGEIITLFPEFDS